MTAFGWVPWLTLKDDDHQPVRTAVTLQASAPTQTVTQTSSTQSANVDARPAEDEKKSVSYASGTKQGSIDSITSDTNDKTDGKEEVAWKDEDLKVFGYEIGSGRPVDESGLMREVMDALLSWTHHTGVIMHEYFVVAYLLKEVPRLFERAPNVQNYVDFYAGARENRYKWNEPDFSIPGVHTLRDLHNYRIEAYYHGKGFPHMTYNLSLKTHRELQRRIAKLYYDSALYEGLNTKEKLTLETALSRNHLITEDVEKLEELNAGLKKWWKLGEESIECPFVFVLKSQVRPLDVGRVRLKKIEEYAKDYAVFEHLRRFIRIGPIFATNSVLTYHLWSECLKNVKEPRNRASLVFEWKESNRSVMSEFLMDLSRLLNEASKSDTDSYRDKWTRYYEQLRRKLTRSRPNVGLYAERDGRYLTLEDWRSVECPFGNLWKPLDDQNLRTPPFASQYPFHPTDIDNSDLYEYYRNVGLTYDYSRHYRTCVAQWRAIYKFSGDPDVKKTLVAYVRTANYDIVHKYFISAVYISLYYDDLSRKPDRDAGESRLLYDLSKIPVLDNLIRDGYLQPPPRTAA